MVPLFLVIKSTGEIFLTQNKADAIAVTASPALRVELQPSVHPGAAVKIATIGGTGPYTVTDAAAGEYNNRHARTF